MKRRLTLARRARAATLSAVPELARSLIAARTRACLVVESRRRDAARGSWLSAIGAAPPGLGLDRGEELRCRLAHHAAQLDWEGDVEGGAVLAHHCDGLFDRVPVALVEGVER